MQLNCVTGGELFQILAQEMQLWQLCQNFRTALPLNASRTHTNTTMRATGVTSTFPPPAAKVNLCGTTWSLHDSRCHRMSHGIMIKSPCGAARAQGEIRQILQ